MPPREDDDVAPRPGAPTARTLMQAGGFALAGIATLAVFLTDNPQLLRLAVVAVAWAFVLATFAAGRRGTDRVAAAAREAELRRAYQLELDREVAARREYELDLETELRRESEDGMRAELHALRGDIAALSGLRDEVARVSALRGDIAALTSLRDEVARVADLRDDVAALNSLRQELGQLADLRADMGRLRAELTEQLSSEMLVERIVMRTQASRLTADSGPGRPLESGAAWADDVPPRELTGGWPAIRLDEPRETQQFEQVRADRPVAEPAPSKRSPAWEPATSELRSWDTPPTASFADASAPPPFVPPPPPPPAYSPPPLSSFGPPVPPPPPAADRQPWSYREPRPDPAEPRLWSASDLDDPAPSRHTPEQPPAAPPTAAFPMSPPAVARTPVEPPPLPSPAEWLAARSLPEPEPASALPEVPPRRRRTDDEPADPAAAPTTQSPAVARRPSPVRVDDRGGYRVAMRDEQPAEGPPGPDREKRLDEILAENGVAPPTGGRRRRRYRDEDEPDDVLARVLGRN
jgi:hypothetical protein